MTEDWNRFLSVVKTDKEGNRLNAVKEDGISSSDEKVIGKRLQEIAKNATTGGLYNPVGELYGFPIKVVSERILRRVFASSVRSVKRLKQRLFIVNRS